MKKSDDIIFGDDLEMLTFIEGMSNQVRIVLSDGLLAANELLTENYKSQIACFLNSSTVWYENSFCAVKDWAKSEYNVEKIENSDLELLAIFILHEQNELGKYGLEFWVSFDEEHGCGLKISDDKFKVLEIGEADTAFC